MAHTRPNPDAMRIASGGSPVPRVTRRGRQRPPGAHSENGPHCGATPQRRAVVAQNTRPATIPQKYPLVAVRLENPSNGLSVPKPAVVMAISPVWRSRQNGLASPAQ